MKQKIISIEKGYGEDSTFFSTSVKVNSVYYVDEIKCVETFIGKGIFNDQTLMMYKCFRGGNLLCEIEANSNLTIVYDTPQGIKNRNHEKTT